MHDAANRPRPTRRPFKVIQERSLVLTITNADGRRVDHRIARGQHEAAQLAVEMIQRLGMLRAGDTLHVTMPTQE